MRCSHPLSHIDAREIHNNRSFGRWIGHVGAISWPPRKDNVFEPALFQTTSKHDSELTVYLIQGAQYRYILQPEEVALELII